MKGLAQIQKYHFKKMSQQERLEVIRSSEQQLRYIDASTSSAADQKREQLQARIDFCLELNNK